MSRICLITALAAETRPLLDALHCRQHSARHLRLYQSDDYLVLETGLGKLNAAAATGAVLQLCPDIRAVVNIGIAGGLFNLGETLVASRVKDEASGAQWYPHLPHARAFRNTHSAALCTVDAPSTDYREGILFDMEAAGIFAAATRYLSTGQIHSIKVVSDNPDNPLHSINKHTVSQIICDALPAIMPLLNALHTQHITQPESHIRQGRLAGTGYNDRHRKAYNSPQRK